MWQGILHPCYRGDTALLNAERGAKASMLSRAGACPSGPRNGFFTTEHTEDGALQGNGERQGDGEEWNR